jgi:hypothetical protein
MKGRVAEEAKSLFPGSLPRLKPPVWSNSGWGNHALKEDCGWRTAGCSLLDFGPVTVRGTRSNRRQAEHFK